MHDPDHVLGSVRLDRGDLPRFLNNADLPTDVSRLKYELISLIAIGVTFLAGMAFYWAGSATRRAMVSVPLEGNEDLSGIAPAAGD